MFEVVRLGLLVLIEVVLLTPLCLEHVNRDCWIRIGFVVERIVLDCQKHLGLVQIRDARGVDHVANLVDFG